VRVVSFFRASSELLCADATGCCANFFLTGLVAVSISDADLLSVRAALFFALVPTLVGLGDGNIGGLWNAVAIVSCVRGGVEVDVAAVVAADDGGTVTRLRPADATSNAASLIAHSVAVDIEFVADGAFVVDVGASAVAPVPASSGKGAKPRSAKVPVKYVRSCS